MLKIKKPLALLSVIMVVSLTAQVSMVSAEPSGTPPAGNVDAKFNSVTANNYSSFLNGIFVNGWGVYTPGHIFSRYGIYNTDNSFLNGAVYIMDALQIFGMIGSTGGAVKIADNDGLQVGAMPASGLAGDFKPGLTISADGRMANPMMTAGTILVPAMNLPVLIDDGLKVLGLIEAVAIRLSGDIEVSGKIYNPGAPGVVINDSVEFWGALTGGGGKLAIEDDLNITGDLEVPANTHGSSFNPSKSGGWYNCPSDMFVVGIQTDGSGNVTGVKCAEL